MSFVRILVFKYNEQCHFDGGSRAIRGRFRELGVEAETKEEGGDG